MVAFSGVVSGSRAVRYNRVSPRASRGAFRENDVSGAVYPSSGFGSPLSVIVKRKHIRSKDWSCKGCMTPRGVHEQRSSSASVR